MFSCSYFVARPRSTQLSGFETYTRDQHNGMFPFFFFSLEPARRPQEALNTHCIGIGSKVHVYRQLAAQKKLEAPTSSRGFAELLFSENEVIAANNKLARRTHGTASLTMVKGVEATG